MPLVRIALGNERALSDSQTAVNIKVTDEELAAILSVDQKMAKACRMNHDSALPRIHVQVLP